MTDYLDKFSMNMVIPSGSADENYEELFISYSEIGEIVRAVKKRAAQMGCSLLWPGSKIYANPGVIFILMRVPSISSDTIG